MGVKIIELQPNRQFIDPEFNGYKLSLDTISMLKKELHVPLHRVLPDSNSYSFLHARLFGLKNHLLGETQGDKDLVYLIDESWSIKKIYIDNSEVEIIDVFHTNKNRGKSSNNHNVCLKLVNENIAILSDGIGKLHILETGDRQQNHFWKCLHVLDPLDNNGGFTIEDACFHKSSDGSDEIHCLLYNIEKTEKDQYFSVLYWLTLDIEEGEWKESSLKKIISSPGTIAYYAFFEPSCEAIYLLSNGVFRFIEIYNNPVVTEALYNGMKYRWSQTCDDITILFKISGKLNMDSVNIVTEENQISIQGNGQEFLCGILVKEIDHSQTTWTIENDCLKIKLYKDKKGDLWKCLILDDIHGENMIDAFSVVETHEKLTHISSETPEAIKGTGDIFDNRQMEECDIEIDDYLGFERLSGITRETTHKVNISTHAPLLNVQKSINLPPALALRHDVDAYIWQPVVENDDIHLRHEGTLNAFGYVQASKQQKKFSVCAPDLSYYAICEATRHLFIYKQCPVKSGNELRNRKGGGTIGHVAQQFVVTLSDDEILGIHATQSKLFLLTISHILVFIL